jgi:hypothetical protein
MWDLLLTSGCYYNLGGAELPYFAGFNWTQSRAPKMTTCLTLLCPNQVYHGEIYNPKYCNDFSNLPRESLGFEYPARQLKARGT